MRVTVEFIDKGPAGKRGAVLRPVGPGSPAPTGEQIRDILEHGVERFPLIMLRAVPAPMGDG
jgi:hypothetical protein